MTKVVALYPRLSPRPDGTYEGVDLQEKWGRAYAARTWPGMPIEVFPDEGISASNDAERPELDRLRTWLADGRVAHVWAVEQSRISRQTDGRYPWFTIAAEMVAAGVAELHTDRDGIVHVDDEVAGIKAVLAAGEIRKIKVRTRSTLAERAAAGRPHGGRTFGYRNTKDADNRKAIAIIAEQAEIVRESADRILAGWSRSNIAADLEQRGIRGANGRPFTYHTVGKMVTNPTVAGLRVHQGEIIGPGVWEPILDMATWQAVVAKLTKPRTTYDFRARRRFLLTGGIARCGVCGGALKAQRRKVKARTPAAIYTCAAGYCVGITADGLEGHVRDRLLDELDKPEFLNRIAADDLADQRDDLVTALEALAGQRRKLAKRWAADALTDAEWDEARAGLTDRERQTRTALAELPPPTVDLDIGQVREAWPDMTLDEKREIVGMFIHHVLVEPAKPGTRAFDPGRVDIGWRTL